MTYFCVKWDVYTLDTKNGPVQDCWTKCISVAGVYVEKWQNLT